MKKILYVLLLTSVIIASVPEAYSFQTTLTPSLSIGEEYTDNVFFADENEQDEFITHISPGISVEMLGQKAGLELTYAPSYAHYQEFDEESAWRHGANLSSWVQLTRNSRLDLRNRFLYTEDPVTVRDVAETRTTEPDLPIDTTLRTGRNSYYRNVADLKFRHQFGQFDFLRLGYRHRILENEERTIDDSSAHGPSAGLTYWFLQTWGFELDAFYTLGQYDASGDIERWQGSAGLLKRFNSRLVGHLRYSHDVVDYEELNETDVTYNPSIGAEYYLWQDVSLYLDIGYYLNDFEARPDKWGPTVDARLTKLYRRGSLRISVLSGYDYALFTTTERAGFERFTEAAVSGTYHFSRSVSSTLRSAYRYSDYEDIDRQDDAVRLGLDLNWLAQSWMSVDLAYAHRLRQSDNGDSSEYDENRVFLGIRVFPPLKALRMPVFPINPNFPSGETAP